MNIFKYDKNNKKAIANAKKALDAAQSTATEAKGKLSKEKTKKVVKDSDYNDASQKAVEAKAALEVKLKNIAKTDKTGKQF